MRHVFNLGNGRPRTCSAITIIASCLAFVCEQRADRLNGRTLVSPILS
jgi:hypothetical protein